MQFLLFLMFGCLKSAPEKPSVNTAPSGQESSIEQIEEKPKDKSSANVPDKRACDMKSNNCQPGTFCDYDIGTCNYQLPKGKCRLVPEVCMQSFDPVCGCDGKTYSNKCSARVKGVSLLHSGECKEE